MAGWSFITPDAAVGTRGVVFLDKDGTVVENVPYNADPARVRLLPGAGEAAAGLCQAGWQLVIVTNQSGVARGFFREEAIREIAARMRELLQEHGADLSAFHYCPHHPEGSVPEYALSCGCRKPAPGLILTACKDLGVRPEDCWMVGDEQSDERAGRAAGCRTILLPKDPSGARGAMDLAEAASQILSRSVTIPR